MEVKTAITLMFSLFTTLNTALCNQPSDNRLLLSKFHPKPVGPFKYIDSSLPSVQLDEIQWKANKVSWAILPGPYDPGGGCLVSKILITGPDRQTKEAVNFDPFIRECIFWPPRAAPNWHPDFRRYWKNDKVDFFCLGLQTCSTAGGSQTVIIIRNKHTNEWFSMTLWALPYTITTPIFNGLNKYTFSIQVVETKNSYIVFNISITSNADSWSISHTKGEPPSD